MESTKAERIQEEKFTIADFEKLLASGTPVFIDYYAPWCGPCKKMEPILNKLSIEFAGKVEIVRINVDEAATLVKSQKIDNIPVISTFKNSLEMKRVNGFQETQWGRKLRPGDRVEIDGQIHVVPQSLSDQP